MHVRAVRALIEKELLNCNIKFIYEGEEEVGSETLDQFCASDKELLTADVIMISDTSIISNDFPSITTGLRGLSSVEVEVTGPGKDLHSGLYGSAVDNQVNVLSDMNTRLYDEHV